MNTHGYGQGQSAGVGTHTKLPGQTYPARQCTGLQLSTRNSCIKGKRRTVMKHVPSWMLPPGPVLLLLLLLLVPEREVEQVAKRRPSGGEEKWCGQHEAVYEHGGGRCDEGWEGGGRRDHNGRNDRTPRRVTTNPRLIQFRTSLHDIRN